MAQKSGLNRAILNVGWHALERMLSYKLEETGGILMKVPAAYTSQTCAACGHVDARSRESQAIFCCTSCGAAANADINAAKTILARALCAAGSDRRENIPLLDVEGEERRDTCRAKGSGGAFRVMNASAPFEASTRYVTRELDAVA